MLKKSIFKITEYIFVSVLLFCLFGCSSSDTKGDSQTHTPDYPVSEKNGEQIYTFRMFEIPVALGYPQIEQKDIGNISSEDINKSINTYADLLNYIVFSEKEDNKFSIQRAATIISEGEYDDVGIISLEFSNEYYRLMYIKTNGKYYPIDYKSQAGSASTKWLAHFEEDNYVSENLEEVIAKLSENFPYKNNYGEYKGYETYSTSYTLIKAPNGEELIRTNRFNEDMIYYADYELPLGLGLPKLTENEIDDLITRVNNGDYECVLDEISTVPDLVMFMRKAGFESRGHDDSIVRTNLYNGADVGNIVYYDDSFMYTISGMESLIIKKGQCTSTTAFFNYVLFGDYEEFGYVNLTNYSDDPQMNGYDGHVFAYIMNNDKYYLIDPANYDDGGTEWMYRFDGEKASSDSIEELIECVYHSTYPSGAKTASVVAFVYDGLYARKLVFSGNKTDASNNVFIMPEGAELKVCIGCKYDFGKPKHPTSHDIILGVELK